MQKRIINKSYSLTEEESLKMKNDLLAEMDNNDVLQVEYERVKLEHRQIIKQSDDLISQLRSNIKSGTKEVQVEISYNYPENGKKTLRRTDTGEETIEDMFDAEVSEYPCEIPFVDTEETTDEQLNIESLEPTEDEALPYEISYLVTAAEENESLQLEVPKTQYKIGDKVKAIFVNSDTGKKMTIIGFIDAISYDSEQGIWLYTIIDDNENIFCIYPDEMKEVIEETSEAI